VQNQTALMWAAAEQHPAVVKALIEAHADLQAHSKKGYTALHFAARVGDQESVRLLLAAGVNVNLRTQPEVADTEPGAETLVAGRGRSRVRGGSFYRKNASTAGYTPLLVATVRGEVATALFLLDQGADPNVLDAGFTPLHWASTTWEGFTANPVYGFENPMAGIPDRQVKLQFVKALLAHGANPNARMTKTQPTFASGFLDAVGATPFLLASSVDDLEMMKLLLAAGADPKRDTSANTLQHAAATGPELTQFLLEAGANPNLLDDERRPLWWRTMEQREGDAASELLRMMLDHGADLHLRAPDGRGPVGQAVSKGYWYDACLLIERGADWKQEKLRGGSFPELLEWEIVRRDEYPIAVPEKLRKVLADL